MVTTFLKIYQNMSHKLQKYENIGNMKENTVKTCYL